MTLSFPSDPINGAVSGEYTYDATKGAWRKNAAYPVSVTHSDVAPSNPREGDQWWKSNEGTLFTYYNDGSSSQWVESTNVVANVEPNPIPAGAMMAWASDVIPANWLLCDGSAVSRSTYASLFAIIGTQYGAGDGTTTFNLPNLKGRTIVGKDSTQTEFDVLGETGGAKTHTLTSAEMPSHTHSQIAHSHSFSGTTTTNGNHSHTTYGIGGFNSSGAGYLALQSDGNLVWYRGNGTTWASGQGAGGSRTQVFVGGDQSYSTSGNGDHSHTFSGTTGNTTAANESTGGGGAHNNLQPYITLNYIIKFSAGETPGDSQLAVRVGTLETQNNSTPLSQNYVINGAFDFWQRGTSITPAASSYTADRWYYAYAGNSTISRESSVVPVGSQYALKLITTAAGQSFPGIYQFIETSNSINMAGKDVTLSVDIKSETVSRTVQLVIRYITTVDAGWSGSWVVAKASSYTVSSDSYNRYSLSTNIPSTAKTVRVEVRFNGTTTGGEVLYISNIQLEEGVYATPFRRNQPNIQAELAACQRYYEKSYELSTAPGTVTLVDALQFTPSRTSANTRVEGLTFKVTKRKIPTVTLYNPSTGAADSIQDLSNGVTKSSAIVRASEIGTNRANTIDTLATLSDQAVNALHFVADAEL